MEGLDHSFGMTSGSQAQALWAELARAAGLPANAPGSAVAPKLDSGTADLLARTLTSLLALVGVEPGAEARVPHVAELLQGLAAPVLTRALQQMDLSDRRRFALGAAELLPAAALAPLLSAGAPTYGQQLSQPFRELLDKLATQCTTLDEHARPKAEDAFRSLFRHVIDTWSALQVNAGATGFEAMFAQEEAPAAVSEVAPEPHRVLQLALETGAIGQIVWTALREQGRNEQGMRALLDMLKHAPPGRAAQMITDQIATPARLGALLNEEPIDWAAVDTLVQQLASNAIRPLLDQLVESNSRAARRGIMDRLVTFGPDIQPLVLERIEDKRWYVVRNMIALLREAGCSLDKVPIDRFAGHTDPRVRREALQLRLENPALRERALTDALQDNDKQVLRTALQAARNFLPDSCVTLLARRVLDPAFPPEFRVLSIYLLGRSGYPTALETLLRFVDGGKSLLGKPRLAPQSAEMLAALSGLARSWPNDRRARELLELAGRSKDEQVLNALRAVGGGDERQEAR